MGLPSGIGTIQVTGNNLCDLEGNPAVSGFVYFRASGQLADPTHNVIISNVINVAKVVNGVMTPVTMPVNDETVNPNGFTVNIRTELYYNDPVTGILKNTPVIDDFDCSLPHTLGATVDIAALAPVSTFTPVNGISIVGTGAIGQVLTNLGNQTANWQNPQASSTTFSRQILIDMTGVHSVVTASVGAWVSQYYADTDTGGVFQGFVSQDNPANQNDSASFDFACGAGTYTLELMHLLGNNRAIYTVKIDGTTIGTIDAYSAGLVYARSKLTGIAITAGQHVLTLLLATKNASSAGYDALLERAVLTQTG